MQQGIFPPATQVLDDEVPPPFVSLDLVEWLESYYPDRLPSPYVDTAELGVLCGQVNAVKLLRQLYNNQSDGKV